MKQPYETVVGLEVHAELCTNSKIFCSCKNEFGALPNTLCCPVCTGMPGALPVLNEQVVEYAIKMGHALHCTINGVSKCDRKNYFYPDLPKAYQISQSDIPLCQNGYFDIWVDGMARRIGITRIHIEEDAGKLVHSGAGEDTLVDYNRCGVPLIEIVSEPDLRSADEAKAYLEGITGVLLYLGISDAKMQEGSVRADVNVSVRPVGQKEYGARTEMKNINSFAAVQRAVRHEAARQIKLLDEGNVVRQQTRRWDDAKGGSTALRSKENVQDYRYFSDPDLLAFTVSQEKIEQIKREIPELPLQKARRYMEEHGLSEYDAMLLTNQKQRADFFDAVVAMNRCEPKAAANWLLGDVARWLNEKGLSLPETELTPRNLAEMTALIEGGVISGAAGKTVLQELMEKDLPPRQLVEQLGLAQITDASVLASVVKKVLQENTKAVAAYKAGKTNVLGFLVGQCMQESRGQGSPVVLKDLLLQAMEAQEMI